MIYEKFFTSFFFVDLVEWRKDEVCTFSHTIRLNHKPEKEKQKKKFPILT
jgi:hypothetical protein